MPGVISSSLYIFSLLMDGQLIGVGCLLAVLPRLSLHIIAWYKSFRVPAHTTRCSDWAIVVYASRVSSLREGPTSAASVRCTHHHSSFEGGTENSSMPSQWQPVIGAAR